MVHTIWKDRIKLARLELQEKMEKVDPKLVHELVGFFYGEGSLFLTTENIGKNGAINHTYRPCISINIRDDDYLLLEKFFETFGGTKLSGWTMKEANGYTSKQQVRWMVQGFPRVYVILEVLGKGLLPSKKKKEIAIAKEACEARFSEGGRVSEELREKLKHYYLALKESKKYPS